MICYIFIYYKCIFLHTSSFFSSFGPYTTINKNSLSGATIISLFLDFIRKNVNSLFGSKSRTVDLYTNITYFAFAANVGIVLAIFSPSLLSVPYVLRIIYPSLLHITIP